MQGSRRHSIRRCFPRITASQCRVGNFAPSAETSTHQSELSPAILLYRWAGKLHQFHHTQHIVDCMNNSALRLHCTLSWQCIKKACAQLSESMCADPRSPYTMSNFSKTAGSCATNWTSKSPATLRSIISLLALRSVSRSSIVLKLHNADNLRNLPSPVRLAGSAPAAYSRFAVPLHGIRL